MKVTIWVYAADGAVSMESDDFEDIELARFYVFADAPRLDASWRWLYIYQDNQPVLSFARVGQDAAWTPTKAPPSAVSS